LIINELNATGPGILPDVSQREFFFDTRHDGRLAPIDALLVINELNREADEQSGEGESFVIVLLQPPFDERTPMSSNARNPRSPSLVNESDEQLAAEVALMASPPDEGVTARDSIFSEPAELLAALEFWELNAEPADTATRLSGRGE